MTALQKGVCPVVGTTGLSAEQIADITHLALEKQIGALVAPNFAIGAILLMRFAAQAAKYFPAVEIIELHHDQKIDAPSGTALKTIEAMQPYPLAKISSVKEIEIVPNSRGGLKDGVRVHSVRLPGFVAHEEVIFGALGQTLTLRHDSINRESFYPGVILAIRNVGSYIGLKVGIDSFLD
jgi:4-hydroxy-tetrahydrodipicolinate reductase